MRNISLVMAVLTALAACSGSTGKDNPFEEDPETTDGTGAGGETGGESERGLPPGTDNPSPGGSIFRNEARDEQGGGFAENIQYNNDQGQDEFSVDNLAFDGDNVYVRGGTAGASQSVGNLGPFAVYESDVTATDPVTGNVLPANAYRAIYGRSTSGQTEFAIVRSGGFASFGFGGFIYQRNGGVVLPTEGDAQYLGDYAAVRVFSGGGGLEYVEGTAEVRIDFKDFNEQQSGVALVVYDRRLFDSAGNDITDAYLAALDEENQSAALIRPQGAGGDVLPNLAPSVSPDIADTNGELLGGMFSTVSYTDGTTTSLQSGQYFGILGGANAEEIVGVLVVTEEDPRRQNVTAQETGGFIVYRQ
ncbi:hypothetical protein [Pseudaestuariivita sp.]|uniref:hypothetical protein n=1 Tax=Pseudaestuariivita sp. TaxID=2211669 RepID=UPI004058D67A